MDKLPNSSQGPFIPTLKLKKLILNGLFLKEIIIRDQYSKVFKEEKNGS